MTSLRVGETKKQGAVKFVGRQMDVTVDPPQSPTHYSTQLPNCVRMSRWSSQPKSPFNFGQVPTSGAQYECAGRVGPTRHCDLTHIDSSLIFSPCAFSLYFYNIFIGFTVRTCIVVTVSVTMGPMRCLFLARPRSWLGCCLEKIVTR
jgi:hypothetical protein